MLAPHPRRFGLQKVQEWVEAQQLASAAGACALGGGVARPKGGNIASAVVHMLDQEEAEMVQGRLNRNPKARWTVHDLMSSSSMQLAIDIVNRLKLPHDRENLIRGWWCNRTGLLRYEDLFPPQQ
jgi:hypothetical protein